MDPRMMGLLIIGLGSAVLLMIGFVIYEVSSDRNYWRRECRKARRIANLLNRELDDAYQTLGSPTRDTRRMLDVLDEARTILKEKSK